MELTVRETAKLLNVTPETVHRWVKDRSLPARRVSEQYRFNRTEILEWAAEQKIPVSPQIFRAGQGAGAAASLLAQSLGAGGIFYDLLGSDQKSVLQALVDQLPLPGGVDRAFLLKMLLAREKLGSTGVGDGIAIPHVRNPIVLHVQAPMVMLGFLRQPVDFHALDSKPVSILFMLITPTIRVHLRLLSELAFALRDKDLRKILQQHAGREEILAQIARIDEQLAQREAHS